MGNILLLFQALLLGINANTVSTETTGPKISFEKTTIKLGDIFVDVKYERDFVFTNTGDEPLIIMNTETACGCTVVNYPKEPIMPGKQGKIKVDYLPKKGTKGFISKSVTITSNAINSPNYIYFQGIVVDKKKKKK